MEVSSYTKPRLYGHKELHERGFGEKTVLVQEKIDGSQFSFALSEEGVLFRSRGQQLYAGESCDKMFAPAVEYVKSIGHKLVLGWTYRGECVTKPRHNALCYERAASGGVVLYDIEAGAGDFLCQGRVQQQAQSLGLDYAPVLDVLEPGQSLSVDRFNELMGTQSVLGGKMEGVVLKQYGSFFRDGKLLAAKMVTDEFKEVHDKIWKSCNPSRSDVVLSLIEQLRSEARWRKAVQHKREEGSLELTPRDIGLLIKEIQEDIISEEAERIKETLYAHFIGKIKRGVVGGFPEWYKSELEVMA